MSGATPCTLCWAAKSSTVCLLCGSVSAARTLCDSTLTGRVQIASREEARRAVERLRFP